MNSMQASVDAVFRRLVREVWIVTAAHDGRRGGLTATWVAPASLDPDRPVLLAGIAPNHFTAELIRASGCFAAHLLRPDQAEIAWNFAHDSGRTRDKFSGLDTRTEITGAPLLTNCLARLEGRVCAEYDAGDRVYFWAEVVAGEPLAAGPSLTDQAFFAAISPERRAALIAGRDADLVVHRPLAEDWRTKRSSERRG